MIGQSVKTTQTLLGLGVSGAGVVFAVGATAISSDAGYAGVGPNFLPWVVAVALMLFGALLVWQSCSGGLRFLDEASGAERADWPAFAWTTAGILANAGLITTIGFILSCTLCFVLAVRGFKTAEGKLDLSLGAWLRDALVGFCIAAPVYWMFTQLLAINLPGLTQTGWL